jgi:hypothetical protein
MKLNISNRRNRTKFEQYNDKGYLFCYCCKQYKPVDMTFIFNSGRISTNISIDKIVPSKGYTMGNIQLVCMACNQIKSDLSESEMYNFCKNIVEVYENKNIKDPKSD